MGRAEELVLLTDASMRAVARQVGYGHASAFIKAFRLHHGITQAKLSACVGSPLPFHFATPGYAHTGRVRSIPCA